MNIQTKVNYNNTNNINFNGKLKVLSRALNHVDDNINPDQIKKVSWFNKIILRQLTPKRIKELAQVNCFIADKIKTHFDNIYGEKNYTLIAIGRSVSSAMETVKILGADAKIIPISGLRKGLPNEIPNIEVYKNFLNSIGLTPNMLNSGKKHILFDYEVEGKSLDNCKKLFEKYIIKGPANNLSTESINNVLKDSFQTMELNNLFYNSTFKRFSSVGKLNIGELEKCFIQSNPNTAEEYKSLMAKFVRKLFLFHVSDNINKNSFDFKYPEKEIQVINSRYFSQKGLAIRFKKTIESLEKSLSILKQ